MTRWEIELPLVSILCDYLDIVPVDTTEDGADTTENSKNRDHIYNITSVKF